MAARPMATGIGLALASAVAFGMTTPLVERFGRGMGSIVTAGLLYGGASLLTTVLRPFSARSGRALTKRAIPRLLLVALFGSVLAPVAMVWGLSRVGALTSSLLLNLEAVFTVLLGLSIHREPLGGRMMVGAVAMVGGGVLLALEASQQGGAASIIGIAALVACTLGWAIDNVLTRGLRDEDPADVVMWKAGLGATATLGVALARGDRWPNLPNSAALLTCGAIGYGASLRLYLLAQRRIGASRTGSTFAIGPFVGAFFGWVLGDRQPGMLALAAGGAFAVGAYLHLTERHGHRHVHEATVHEHAHRHDDGHHTHVHDSVIEGEHTHEHRHEPLTHDHEHALDVHHDHPHG